MSRPRRSPPREVALVTGAARGLGLAIARGFFARGAAVVLVDRSPEVVAAARALDGKGARAHAVVADVTVDAEVAGFVGATLARFGRLDSAVNAAGVLGPTRALADLTPADYDFVVGVNLGGTWLSLQHELRAMTAGAIVNVASVTALRPVERASLYSAAKAGVVGLTRAAAIEYAARGIRVNALCPGAADTEMLRESQRGRPEQVEDRVPLGRAARPDEIAAAALWLCSPAASYVTGAALVVDGGFSLW